MTKAEAVMDDFMKKLHGNEFESEKLQQEGPEMDDAFVAEQIASYFRLLKSGLLETALDNQ